MLTSIYCWLFGHNDLWYLTPGQVRVKCFTCDRVSRGFVHVKDLKEGVCDTSLLHLR